MRTMLIGFTIACAGSCAGAQTDSQAPGRDLPRPPNIILIMADDLGIGDVGCYSDDPTRIRTPNIDSLALQGMRFTQAYAGAPVCAPSRCALLTGRSMSRAAIRDNLEIEPEGQQPLPADEITLAEVLKPRGYATACIGKWGLGPPDSEGDPLSQGFDHFFGYNCQRHAHNHYPTWLYRDREKITLEGNVEGDAIGKTYAPDLMREGAIAFIRRSKEQPFFLFFATTIPHAALQVPEDSLREYDGKFEETPYDGMRGYLPHATPRAAYAAMVTRLDRDIGMMLATLDELDLAKNTIVIFTSDNGPTYNGGTDSEFFHSTSGLRGVKGQLYEGGLRVPLLIRWPGPVVAQSECNFETANWDLLPTLAAIAHAEAPKSIDGVDLSRALLGAGVISGRPPLYWEHASGGFWQAIRVDRYKGVRRKVKGNPNAPVEVYDLAADRAESTDIAAKDPELAAYLLRLMQQRITSPIEQWNP